MAKQIDRRSLLKTAGATAALAGFGLERTSSAFCQ
jgi:hypothetical protein